MTIDPPFRNGVGYPYDPTEPSRCSNQNCRARAEFRIAPNTDEFYDSCEACADEMCATIIDRDAVHPLVTRIVRIAELTDAGREAVMEAIAGDGVLRATRGAS